MINKDTDMRTAICLFGTIGGTKGKAGDKIGSKEDVFNCAYPHYKEKIINPNSSDVFIHSWDLDIEEQVKKVYEPKLSKFEEQKTFKIPDFMDKTQRVQNHFSRWYSCKQVADLLSSYEQENNFKYDMVILCRQDIAWKKEIIFENYDKNFFYVPKWFQHHTGEPMGYPHGVYNKSLQDIWCFSNSDNIKQLCEIYDNIPKYCSENKELTAHGGISNHRLMYHQLCKMNVIPNKIKFPLSYDRPKFADTPLIRWVYFDEPTNYGMLIRREKDFSLENNLSVIQCHILFDDERGRERLEHQKSFKGIPSFGSVFNDCHFYVNYKTLTFIDDIKETYEKYIKNINLYNNLDGKDFNWAAVILSLVNESHTPYLMLATEDRMFHKTNKEEFEKVMQDIIDNDVQYMPIGKLDHLTIGSRYETFDKLMSPVPVHGKICKKKYRDSGKELFIFNAKDAPVKITSFSADAVYKREFLISLLEDMIFNYGLKEYSPNARFEQNTSKYFEDYFSDNGSNGVRAYGELICAVPKKEIVVSDETPGESLGKISDTSTEILELDVRI